MVLLQKCSFVQLFCLCDIGQEKVWYDILKRKSAFLGYKNKNVKKSKNWHFSKGVNLWFCSKNGHSFNFFCLGNIGQENLFHGFLERENAILGYKKTGSKSRKIDIFPKGLTHRFGPKMAIFPTFFFRQYRPGKCLLRYSRTKKALSRALGYKNKKFKKSKNWHFFNEVNQWFCSKRGKFFNFFYAIEARKISITVF